MNPRHRGNRVIRWRTAHDHRKLVAAKTSYHIAAAQRHLQLARQGNDRLISDIVPPGIVNALKVIDIDDEQRGVPVVAATVIKFITQQYFPVTPVIDAGHAIPHAHHL